MNNQKMQYKETSCGKLTVWEDLVLFSFLFAMLLAMWLGGKL